MDNEKYGIELELITSKFNEKMQKVKNSFSALENKKINLSTNTAQIDYLKQQINDIVDKIRRIDAGFETGNVLKYEAQLEKLTNQYNKLIGKQNEVNVTQGKINLNFSKGFDRINSKIKRFGLSLLGIRTIWSLVSRASSAYMAQDTQLANKLQSVWAGLGAMLAPIIERIVEVLIKGVKYINVFIKALTGVDLLARASAKSMANATKSAKSLNKALAGFDELTNIDTDRAASVNPFAAFKDVDLNPQWVSRIEEFAQFVKDNFPTIVGIVGALALAFGLDNGLAFGIGAVVLAGDGLKKLFDKDLNKSFEGLIELLGAGGLIGLLTGKWGVVGALAGVVTALFGLNEMMNGDTPQAIEGLILLIGGAGLAGYFLGGVKGVSLGIAIAGVIAILQGFNDLINGDTTDTVKGFIEIVVGAAGLVAGLALLKGGIKALFTPTTILAVGFVALAAGIVAVTKSWGNMSTWERVASVLGLIAIGAATAAAAVGALQSAWSLGIAAAAIVAGVVAIAAAVSSANQRAQENIPKLAVGTNYVPQDQLAMIHKGEAVVPKKFNSKEYFGGSNEETNARLEELIEAVRNIEINPYTTIKDVGKASLNYINSKSRQLGESVVV